MKTVIVNDTSDVHFGCALTMEVYREQLTRVGIELIGTVKMQDDWTQLKHRHMLDEADLVIVNGEGSVHHGRRQDLIEIALEYPSVLLNCVYQDNPDNDAIFKFKLVTARESISQSELPFAELVPDLVFASRIWSFSRWEENEKPTTTTDSADGTRGFAMPREYFDFIQLIQNRSGVCAGRFHAIVACAILGVPFSAYASNTHKNRGIMYDMAVDDLYKDKMEDAVKIIPKKPHPAVGFYARTAVKRITNLFDSLESYAD